MIQRRELRSSNWLIGESTVDSKAKALDSLVCPLDGMRAYLPPITPRRCGILIPVNDESDT